MDAKQIIEQNRRAYNAIAEDFFVKKQREWKSWKQSFEYLTKYIKKGDKILDIGCGFGRLYQLMDNSRIAYIGIDQSEEMIKIARQKFPSRNFIVSEMTKLPFSVFEFDVVYCLNVLHHLLDESSQNRALKEIRRVLKPGGLVIMANWNLFSKNRQKKIKAGDYQPLGENNFLVPWKNSEGKILGERFYHAFTLKELADLFKKVGFKVEENYYTKKGEKSSVREGENILTFVNKK